MLLRSKPNDLYRKWNSRWGAPYGIEYSPKSTLVSTLSITRYINRLNLLNKSRIFACLLGMFAFEKNSSNRIYEYPWAFYATRLSSSMKILEIGGGFSGFQFVLAKHVNEVINIDPLENGRTKLYNQTIFNKLNSAFHTNAKLCLSKIQEITLRSNYFDRIFCISVLDHLNRQDRKDIMKHAYKALKPRGFFVISVDLFLDLVPFSNKTRNQYGTNASIYELVRQHDFRMVFGNADELYGFPTFDHNEIMSNLSKYLICNSYPILSQVLVLQKF